MSNQTPQDPRFKNKTFNTESIRHYLTDYSAQLEECLKSVSQEKLNAAALLMHEVRNNKGRVFVAGNGGSAAISEHLSCDWQKGVHLEHMNGLKVQCLTSNTALLTAIANDYGYDQAFSYQLEFADVTKEDLVLLISSSGNSDNIIKAALFAKNKGCKVIGLTGFTGGKLKDLADVSLHIPFSNYGLVEDGHQVLMHVLAQYHDIQNRQET
jgi:D-sedoheptulose 7-phosphate isomerase